MQQGFHRVARSGYRAASTSAGVPTPFDGKYINYNIIFIGVDTQTQPQSGGTAAVGKGRHFAAGAAA